MPQMFKGNSLSRRLRDLPTHVYFVCFTAISFLLSSFSAFINIFGRGAIVVTGLDLTIAVASAGAGTVLCVNVWVQKADDSSSNDETISLEDAKQTIDRLAVEASDTNELMQMMSLHFNDLFRNIPAPCFCFDADGSFKEWNKAFETLTLLEPNKIINKPVADFIRVDGDDAKINYLISAVFNGETFDGIELQTVFVGGANKTILCNLFPLRGEKGTVTAAVCAGIDVTERIRLEQRMLNHVEMLSAAQLQLEEQHTELVSANTRLEMLAMSDSLTGLKNHRALQERLTAEFKRSKRYGEPVSILLVDVDRFKKYNDSYGHLAGDGVLQRVAEILKKSMRDTDFVARYGGEEFVVILSHTDYLGALEAAERVRTAVEQAPWDLIRVTVSIGVSTVKSSMKHYSDLVTSADIALYHCKQHGRNQVIHSVDLPEDRAQLARSLRARPTGIDESSSIAG